MDDKRSFDGRRVIRTGRRRRLTRGRHQVPRLMVEIRSQPGTILIWHVVSVFASAALPG